MEIKTAIGILRKSNAKLLRYTELTLPLAVSRRDPAILKGYETQKKCRAEYEAVELAIKALEEKQLSEKEAAQS